LYLVSEKPDIIGITETWLNDEILSSELHLGGYNVIRKDRKNRHGGE
jgi:hypothetical protein